MISRKVRTVRLKMMIHFACLCIFKVVEVSIMLPLQGGDVIASVSLVLFVCLSVHSSVFEQDCAKRFRMIFMKLNVVL